MNPARSSGSVEAYNHHGEKKGSSTYSGEVRDDLSKISSKLDLNLV